MNKINIFLPCRKGSERVLKKNVKPFSVYKNGLIEIKIKQLLNIKFLDKIFLSTNDDEIIKYVEHIGNPKIILHRRSEKLSSSSTSTDDLVLHALELIKKGEILWTHVTSPFITTELYNIIIDTYFQKKLIGFDSLMTTNLLHGFLWGSSGPLNYNPNLQKWPNTQCIDPVHEINSGVFLANADIYKSYNNRIGSNPYMYVLDKVQGFDIDWQDDFYIAQSMVESGVAKI